MALDVWLRHLKIFADFLARCKWKNTSTLNPLNRLSGATLRAPHEPGDALCQLGPQTGCAVSEAVAYHTIPGVTGDAREVRAALAGDPESVVIALASPSALDALIAALGADLVGRATLLAGGPTTQRFARERLGPDAHIEITVEEPAHVAHR